MRYNLLLEEIDWDTLNQALARSLPSRILIIGLPICSGTLSEEIREELRQAKVCCLQKYNDILTRLQNGLGL